MKRINSTISLFKWIWHSYLRTTLIPLVLVELVFIGIYFFTNNWSQTETVSFLKNAAKTELNQIAKQEANAIENKITSISNAADLYREQAKDALLTPVDINSEYEQRLAYSPQGVYYTTSDKKDKGVAIFYSGISPINQAEREKVAKVLTMQKLMKDITNTQPLAASVYLNTFDSLNVIYPYFDVISQYETHMDIPSYNFYYEADYAHNPDKTVKWTDSYLDPAGHGWMASAIAPVYNGDFLEGVVGIDITIDTITTEILKMDIPWGGYGVLVGNDGTILALPEAGEKDWGLDELTDHTYNEAILKDTFKPDQFNLYKREDLSVFAEKVKGNKDGFSTIILNDISQVASWDTIADTDWKLLIIAPENNIYQNVNEMRDKLFQIGTYMIVGLVCFYSIFFFILARKAKKMSLNISQPLLQINGIVKNIGKGDYYQHEPDLFVEELKETAYYLVNMGKELGASNEKLLEIQAKLRKKESDLQSLVNSIDDVILEIDDEGIIKNMWSKDDSNISKTFLEGNRNSIFDVFDNKIVEIYKMKIKKVIKTGEADTIEYALETKKGYRWFQARIALVANEDVTVVVSARDITDRKEMEKSLIESKDEANKANKAKSQFLSSMSHELRTPLNAILGFSQILEIDVESPLDESQSDSVKEISKAGNHLLLLINEVLDLAKIESGKVTMSIEAVQVGPILEETFALIKPLADKYGIEITNNGVQCINQFMLADRTRIKQILINLLSNAVKYNRENGRVILSCEKTKHSIKIHVIDTGYGIPKDELEEIFKPFYRVNETNRIIEGTGIGLTVSKQLIELMDGRIFVESKEGEGCHFWIELPCTNTPVELPNEMDSLLENSHKVLDEKMQKIVYIEDNPSNVKLVERILMNIPTIKLFSAASGEIGLDFIRTHYPDLILVDINLPGIDGYEVCRRLKESEETRNIPIFAISANAMQKQIEKGLAMGFDDYITKPIDVSILLEKVLKILK